jgi:hypothetical protein
MHDYQHELDSDLDSNLSLACPACGEPLVAVPSGEDLLCCPAHHQYTLPTLLLGQSMRAAALFEAGARLLEEQEHLVRAIASQLWNTQTLTAFKLEGQADRLMHTTEVLRKIIKDGAFDSPSLAEKEEKSAN